MGLVNKAKSPQPEKAEDLSPSEIKYILKVISEAKVEGKDVFFVGNLVQKLTDSLESE